MLLALPSAFSWILVYLIATVTRSFSQEHQDTFWEKVVQPAFMLAIFALGGTAHEANDPQDQRPVHSNPAQE